MMKAELGIGEERDRAGDDVRLSAAVLRGDGRHVDDAPVMLRPHAFDGLLDGQEIGGQVDREDPIPAFRVRVVERVFWSTALGQLKEK
ncbi:hypothetical protein [Bifidobacterium erythrocebi]|uniref:hypothetical protein n=1 Tax=Bifidobacterium erythrocebi TaxID=2675325 RepID=UPI00145F6527|nr:hypothetical protein [Bifidobacterium sp. DSM 109960]